MKVLEFLGGCDSPEDGWCFNVYINNDTGTTYVERVWNNVGVTVTDCKGITTEITVEAFGKIKKDLEGVTL